MNVVQNNPSFNALSSLLSAVVKNVLVVMLIIAVMSNAENRHVFLYPCFNQKLNKKITIVNVVLC